MIDWQVDRRLRWFASKNENEKDRLNMLDVVLFEPILNEELKDCNGISLTQHTFNGLFFISFEHYLDEVEKIKK
jgi:hypothetical protein